jgi:hypothetical protein
MAAGLSDGEEVAALRDLAPDSTKTVGVNAVAVALADSGVTLPDPDSNATKS